MERRKFRMITALVLLTVFVMSCNFIAPVPEPQQLPPTVISEPTFPSPKNKIPLSEAEVPRVQLEQALTALQSGEAIIVDVRSPEAYEASHIAGAISVPLDEIESNPGSLNLDKDQWIITYCT